MAFLLVLQWYGKGVGVQRVFIDGRAWAWILLDGLLLVLVGRYVWAQRTLRSDVDLRVSGWMWVVPALVVLNGMSPFLELRTAYAFNMYSNLETASGDSNHFLVPRTLPLTDYQDDRVSILESSDPDLQLYATQQFDIPFLQLRDYLSQHRDASLRLPARRPDPRGASCLGRSGPGRAGPVVAVEALRLPVSRPDRTQPLPACLPARSLGRECWMETGAMAPVSPRSSGPRSTVAPPL